MNAIDDVFESTRKGRHTLYPMIQQDLRCVSDAMLKEKNVRSTSGILTTSFSKGTVCHGNLDSKAAPVKTFDLAGFLYFRGSVFL